MKMLAAVLLLLALINLGYACLLVVRGRADASVLPKEVFGKPSVVGDALDLNLAVERTEAALGRRLEPDLQAFAEWLTQERSRGTLAFHRTAAGFVLFDSVAAAACSVGALLIAGRKRGPFGPATLDAADHAHVAP